MIRQCTACKRRFEDEYRSTICPHQLFAANDGSNNFRHHPEAYLSDEPPARSPAQGAPYGPCVVNGHLFHKLLDGSSVSCVCIQGEPAQKVVAASRHRVDAALYEGASGHPGSSANPVQREETIDGRAINRTGRPTMSEPHELEERAEHAWSAERQKWLISGDGERVFSLDDAGIDDPPRFIGLYSECEQFVRSHCIRAVLALVRQEQEKDDTPEHYYAWIRAWWLSHTAKETNNG